MGHGVHFKSRASWSALDRLYFTVFTDDDEAAEIWHSLGVAEDHISRLGERTTSGQPVQQVHGPCSEIYFDQGPGFLAKPGDDGDRYLEFWNLVFTQYDRRRRLHAGAPHRNIDTGMALNVLPPSCSMRVPTMRAIL